MLKGAACEKDVFWERRRREEEEDRERRREPIQLGKDPHLSKNLK